MCGHMSTLIKVVCTLVFNQMFALQLETEPHSVINRTLLVSFIYKQLFELNTVGKQLKQFILKLITILIK